MSKPDDTHAAMKASRQDTAVLLRRFFASTTKKEHAELQATMQAVGFANVEEELLEWREEQQLIECMRRGGCPDLVIFSSIFLAAMQGVRLREFWRNALLDEARRINKAHGPRGSDHGT